MCVFDIDTIPKNQRKHKAAGELGKRYSRKYEDKDHDCDYSYYRKGSKLSPRKFGSRA